MATFNGNDEGAERLARFSFSGALRPGVSVRIRPNGGVGKNLSLAGGPSVSVPGKFADKVAGVSGEWSQQ